MRQTAFIVSYSREWWSYVPVLRKARDIGKIVLRLLLGLVCWWVWLMWRSLQLLWFGRWLSRFYRLAGMIVHSSSWFNGWKLVAEGTSTYEDLSLWLERLHGVIKSHKIHLLFFATHYFELKLPSNWMRKALPNVLVLSCTCWIIWGFDYHGMQAAKWARK